MQRRFAEHYGSFEQWHWWFRGRRRILEEVLRRELVGQMSLSIASVGCGPAAGLRWLRSLAGPEGCVVGLDADPLHARRLGPGLEYVVGKFEAAPLASGSFDVVLALEVLEHLDDDAAGLREAARVLKPGGMLLVTVPALPSLWGGQDVVSHHQRRYTKRTLCRAFANAQLPRPSVTYFNTLLFPPIAAVRWARRVWGLAHRPRSDLDDNHPGLINEILAAVFATERRLVGRVPMPVGISLLATTRLGESPYESLREVRVSAYKSNTD
jgi:SAM-dependent methyltransferase